MALDINPQRATYLFSKFRSYDSNPEGFDAKLREWFKLINDWCLKSKNFTFNLSKLQHDFNIDGKSPDETVLLLVATHMKNDCNLVPIEDYHNQAPTSWLSSISSGFSGQLSSIKSVFNLWSGKSEVENERIDGNIRLSSQFVNINAVQKGAEDLGRRIIDFGLNGKCLVEKEAYDIISKKYNINHSQLEYLVNFMVEKNLAVRVLENGISFVKFGENEKFNHVDIGLVKLEKARELVESDIEKIEVEMENATQEARKNLQEGNRTRAKAMLRRKKRLEALIGKKEGQLDNIQTLIVQLENVDSNKQLFKTFANCADVLKVAQENTAELTMSISEMEGIFEQQNEMVNGLNKNLGTQISDEDLEEELMDLIGETNPSTSSKTKTNLKKSTENVENDELDEIERRLERLKHPNDDGSPRISKRLAT